MRLHFWGAAQTVTGSKYCLETAGGRLLVDCGLFQGSDELEAQNALDLPMPASEIDAVLLTHAHLDHCGYLPRLVRNGFKGPIYATEPSIKLADLLLQDVAHLFREEAKLRKSKGDRSAPSRVLYGMRQVLRTRELFHVVGHTSQEIFPGVTAQWHSAGHILGSAWIELKAEGKTLVFSGDLGRPNDLLLYPPERPTAADVLLIESTYGDRLHPDVDVYERLEHYAHKAFKDGGSLLLPCFAIERTQVVLHVLAKLRQQGRLPAEMPMLLDTPMGHSALEFFRDYPQELRLNEAEIMALSEDVRVVHHANDSRRWARNGQPKIVLAGSGMLTGGRIHNYLEHELGNPRTQLLLTGYQAEGTPGRLLQDGIKTLRLNHHDYAVALQVATLAGLSAHADRDALLDWTQQLEQAPAQLCIVHGEKHAAESLQQAFASEKAWMAHVPTPGSWIEI